MGQDHGARRWGPVVTVPFAQDLNALLARDLRGQVEMHVLQGVSLGLISSWWSTEVTNDLWKEDESVGAVPDQRSEPGGSDHGDGESGG